MARVSPAITVTVLGSSGSYAAPDNPCTGFVVASRGATVLFDCGPGTLGPLQAVTDVRDLTAVVISHCHPDHWLELPVLRNVFLWFQPRDDVPVYGPAEVRDMDEAVNVVVDGAPDPFTWTTIDPTTRITIGDQEWSFDVTDHPVETLAARVGVGERSVLFTSDTGPGWTFDSFGRAVDAVFCDASHLCDYEDQGIPHLSAREAAERARSAGVGRLVLTHLIPGSDPAAHRAEAATAYGGPIDVARPGTVIEI